MTDVQVGEGGEGGDTHSGVALVRVPSVAHPGGAAPPGGVPGAGRPGGSVPLVRVSAHAHGGGDTGSRAAQGARPLSSLGSCSGPKPEL
ncbi:hypothetical protein [Streptomyces sp. NPDC046197]|uniref:hypothetical protein n=1 Tax=Streptomyces sp. NPDC046197 TaxID=3154337 RepID=UPI00340D9D8A